MTMATTTSLPLDLAGGILRSLRAGNSGDLDQALERAEQAAAFPGRMAPDLAERLELIGAIAIEMRVCLRRQGSKGAESADVYIPLLRHMRAAGGAMLP